MRWRRVAAAAATQPVLQAAFRRKICHRNPIQTRCASVRQLNQGVGQQLGAACEYPICPLSALGAVFQSPGRLLDCDVPTESLRGGAAATLRPARGWGHESAGARAARSPPCHTAAGHARAGSPQPRHGPNCMAHANRRPPLRRLRACRSGAPPATLSTSPSAPPTLPTWSAPWMARPPTKSWPSATATAAAPGPSAPLTPPAAPSPGPPPSRPPTAATPCSPRPAAACPCRSSWKTACH